MPDQTVASLKDAELLFERSLVSRGAVITDRRSNVKPGNSLIFTNNREIYHVKFTRTPFTPDADKKGGARDLHLKLQFAMQTFEYVSSVKLASNEKGTMVGLDEDLLLELIRRSEEGYRAFVVTILERGLILWLEAREFYDFVMRYDTFMKFPRSGVPVCYVPTGYFLIWDAVVTGLPVLAE